MTDRRDRDLVSRLRRATHFDPRPLPDEIFNLPPEERSGYEIMRRENQAFHYWIMCELRPLLREAIDHLNEDT